MLKCFFSLSSASPLFLGSEGSSVGLGEYGLSRQSRRAKHRPEKEPWHANNLRKRRSFLQTNFTSQVTFPEAPPHIQENTGHACHDGDPVLAGASCSPAEVCSRDPKSASDLLEPQHLDHLSKNEMASSDVVKMESDSLKVKPGTDSAACPVSVSQVAQEGRKCSDFGYSSSSTETHDGPFISSPNSDNGHNCLDMLEVPSQLVHSATCQEKAEETAGRVGGIQECSRTSMEHCINDASQRAEAVPEMGISYVLIEEIIHTTTKPSRSLNGKKLSYGPSSGQDLLSPEKLEKHKHLVLDPCVSEPILYKSRQGLEDSLLPEETNRMSSEGSSKDPENNQHLDFSSTTELLSDSDSIPGIVTRLSWLAFSSMVDHPERCPETGDKPEAIVSPSVPDVHQLALNGGELHQVPHNLPSVPVMISDVDSHQKGDRITGETLDANYILPMSLTLPKEGSGDERKAPTSDGLDCVSLGGLCKLTEPGEESSVSNLNGQKLCSDNATEATTTPNVSSHTLMNIKEIVPLEHKMDRCSCQLTYTSCFSGPDHEAELENANPTTCGASEGPLTTPPSTKGPVSLDFNPTGFAQECNSVANINSRKHDRWLPESHTKALDHMKDRMHAPQFDFCHLLDSVVELQEILNQFWGSKVKHPRDECSALFSENRNTLYVESQRLASSCQKVIKAQGPSSEMHNALQESFRNLLQLTEACLQFTNCGLCSGRHKDLIVNLKDAICSYHHFAQAAKESWERNYPDLSVKLLVCQYTALTAALFCLMQQFRASPCV